MSNKAKYFSIIEQDIEFKSKKFENCYLNDKILSDELQYVLDRKQYETTLGNSLENPSLLLKPQFIRETTTEIKEGKEGRDFGEKYKEKSYYKNKKAEYSASESNETGGKSDKIKIHDFINVSPYIKENLIPDENGIIITIFFLLCQLIFDVLLLLKIFFSLAQNDFFSAFRDYLANSSILFGITYVIYCYMFYGFRILNLQDLSRFGFA